MSMSTPLHASWKWYWVPLAVLFAVGITAALWQFGVRLSLDGLVQSEDGPDRMTAGLIIVAIMVGDLFIPIPSTLLMPVAGHVFGLFWGVVIVSTGSILLSLAGYGLGRYGTKSIISRIVSPIEVTKMERWMSRYGHWPVLFSKTLPMMAETVSLTAGIARMKFSDFMLYTVLGTLPVCFIYVWAGEHAERIETLLLIAAGGFLITLAAFAVLRRALGDK